MMLLSAASSLLAACGFMRAHPTPEAHIRLRAVKETLSD
jgi:hypothetical protein